jgi:hypothetical protein
MKRISTIALLFIIFLSAFIPSKNDKQTKDKLEYYQIIVYHFTNAGQESILDNYLEKALLPVLHKNKFENIGVFKPVTNDTAADKKIYIFINANAIEKLISIDKLINADPVYKNTAKDYLEAAFDKAPFQRYETILLKAFPLAAKMNLPILSSAKSEHIYELRSYESATEGLYKNKVKMFNEGGEIELFKQLGFNAVFYADVLSGCRMPNLMYLTSFENMPAREAHWKSFGESPEWKHISKLPEYQNNVSKADIILMHATAYSDF